jgi:hypothetical protein
MRPHFVGIKSNVQPIFDRNTIYRQMCWNERFVLSLSLCLSVSLALSLSLSMPLFCINSQLAEVYQIRAELPT